MENKTFAFLRKNGKKVHPKTKKKNKQTNKVDAKVFNGENAISRYTVTADFKIEYGK